ncbi:MAG: hypothetical protein JWP39_1264 [Jatrophihabitans sp.]|nr:hypothetical protein [Jatrophihabitans sp.]
MVIAGDPVGGSAAQEAAKAELRRHEYHRDEPSLLTRAVHWLGDKLGALFSGGGGSHALLLLLVAVLAVVVVVAVRAGVPGRTVRGRSADDVDPLAPIAARDHRGRALQLAAEGRRAEALREWLRAAVQTIEERGVLPPRPGRTGAATSREAGPLLPTAAADLAVATEAFDAVWFGGREASDTDVQRARAAADGVASARVVAGVGASGEGIAAPW